MLYQMDIGYFEFSEFVLGVLSYWFIDCLIKEYRENAH